MSSSRLLAPESQSQSDNTQSMSQQEQPRGLRNGQDPRGSVTQAEWTLDIEENADFERRSPFVVSIFRVPKTLMKVSKEEAYVPTRVSIGPYHQGRAELLLMDNHKEKALLRVISRRNGSDPNNTGFSDARKELVGKILPLEKPIGKSYEEEIDFDGGKLSLDGCFILEILRTLGGDNSPGENRDYEPLFQSRKINYTGIDILNDILKLENQIPLIVLRELLQWELKSDDVEEKLFDLLYKPFLGFFYPFDCKKNMCSWRKPDVEKVQPDVEKVHHLLGLLHACIVSPDFDNSIYEENNSVNEEGERPDNSVIEEGEHSDNSDCSFLWMFFIKFQNILKNIFKICNWNKDDCPEGEEQYNALSGDIESIPHAVQLRKSGIKFKKFEKDDGDGIRAICFDKKSATIFLPTIIITDSTEIVFRNVIAFEMCKQFQMNPVAYYLSLMGMLIGSEEDVALLTRKGIITNWLGSDKEVAELFHGLCKGIAANTNYPIGRLVKQVNLYYRNTWSVWFAEFKHRYFSSPWNLAGLFAAIALLVLTVLQTVYAILTYKASRS